VDVGSAEFWYDQGAAYVCEPDNSVATDMMMMMPPAFAPPPTGQMDLQYEDFFNIGDIDCPITSDLSFDFNDKSFFDFCSPEIQDTKLS